MNKFNTFILIFLTISFLISIFMNIRLIKGHSDNKKYVECYKAMCNKEENVKEKIEEFIANSKSEANKNKAKVLLLCVELDNGLDYSKTLEEIDLKDCFFVKDKFNKNVADINSDIYIWIIIAMVKAKKNKDKKLIEAIYEKLNICSEIDNYVEFKCTQAVKDVLMGGKGLTLFNSLHSGDYIEYKYDKKLIGIYKRIASCILVYMKKPIDEYFEEDLKSFRNTIIGSVLMQDLNIYDKYKEEDPIQSEE